MDVMDRNQYSASGCRAAVGKATFYPGSAVLRRAVRRNIVSFPSRVPVLLKIPADEMQWRAVLLYFVRGWSSAEIGARFRVPKHQIRQVL